jgi:hypothetical protein
MRKHFAFAAVAVACALVATPGSAQVKPSNDPATAKQEIDNLAGEVYRPGNAYKANRDLEAYCKEIEKRVRNLNRSDWEPVARHCAEALRVMRAYNPGRTPPPGLTRVERPESFNGEALAFAGGTSASSLGSNFHTGSFGGRAAIAFSPAPLYTLQADLQGSGTGSYCAACGTSSNVAGGGHFDVRLGSADLGLFGGFQGVNPLFMTPSSTNGFAGVEFRNSFNNWMLVGAQAGFFSDVSGPGTLTQAAFIDVRAKFALGPTLGYSGFGSSSLGLRLGYAEGSLGHSSINANSLSWGAILSYPVSLGVSAPPLTLFAAYDGFQNRTALAGTVWQENMFKGGVKLDFGGPPKSALEPTLPFPTGLLQANYKF